MMKRKMTVILLALLLTVSMAACRSNETAETTESTGSAASSAAQAATQEDKKSGETTASKDADKQNQNFVTTTANVTSDGMIDASSLFSDRDLRQNADLSEATQYTLSDNSDITITAEGVYVISGSASNASIIVEAGDNDKVQIVLNGVSVTNASAPAIYVKNADKVFVTTAESTENTLTVSGSFTADGDTNTDAVIFSKDDLVLNGLGTLNINSSDNGISGKDDIKITGGTYNISAVADAIEANDSIAVADGNITVTSAKDGLHAENDEDDSTGYIYICGGTFNITSSSDGIQATTVAQIDDGNITISSSEGIEGTFVQINGGNINIAASDDGVNGSHKSSAYTVTVEINGGELTINMGQGDTDAIDSNGNLYINGGTINITAQSPFDYDGEGKLNGGTVYVNGTQTTELTNQMMGGGMGGPGGMGGGPGMGGGMNGGPGQGGFGR